MSSRQLTTDQLALSQFRKQQKLLRKTQQQTSNLHPRQWLSFPADHIDASSYRLKVLSWNVCSNIILLYSFEERWTSYSFLHNPWFVSCFSNRLLLAVCESKSSQVENSSQPVAVLRPTRENHWYTKKYRGKMLMSSAFKYNYLDIKCFHYSWLPPFVGSW